ncbi:MAG TPA: hypothetical protein GXX23_02760 [Firmicutes bacterium]|nr:hypothetical protein [Candidatus Fermentithermobacillaceae bacterium]
MSQALRDVVDRFIDLQLFAEGDKADPTKDQLSQDKDGPQGGSQGGDTKTFDEAYVKSLREEAAKYRTKAKELESKLETLPTEITSKVLKALGLEPDPQKNFEQQLAEANRKAQEAEQKAKARLIAAEVKLLAAEMGLIDADAALALMDKSNVEVDDAGNVKGVKEALEALVKAKSWLKKQSGPVGGGTNPPGAGGAEVNPWKKETFNLTKQAQILKENPALAARFKAEAGVR